MRAQPPAYGGGSDKPAYAGGSDTPVSYLLQRRTWVKIRAMGMPPVLSGHRCYHCGSTKTSKDGFSRFNGQEKQRFFCRSCGRRFRERPDRPKVPGQPEKQRVPKNAPSAAHLVLELRALAQRLGRTPTLQDVRERSKRRLGSSDGTYRGVFGSFREALRRARLTPGHLRQYSPERIIAELRALRKKLGRPLLVRDVLRAAKTGRAPSRYFMTRAFGSPIEALRAAGVARKAYNRAEMISCLRALDASLDRAVTREDIKELYRQGKGPSVDALRSEFGGLTQAARIAGMKRNSSLPREFRRKGRRHPFTDDQLIACLKALADKLGHPPAISDVNEGSKNKVCPSAHTYQLRFGSMIEAFRRAGFDLVESPAGLKRKYFIRRKGRKDRPKYTDEELLATVRRFIADTGRFPMQKELIAANRAAGGPSADSVIAHLGKLSDIRKRYFPDVPVREPALVWSEEDIIAAIGRLAEEVGRFPTYKELMAAHRAGKCPADTHIRRRLGSLAEIRRRYFPHLAAARPRFDATNEQIIAWVQGFLDEQGRFPSRRDFDAASREGNGPHSSTVRLRFGSLVEMRSRYFPKLPKKQVAYIYSDEEIIAGLKKLIERLGRYPTYAEIDAANKVGLCPSTTAIAARFGGVSKALRRLFPGHARKVQKRPVKYTDGELVAKLKGFVKELGKFPTDLELRAASREGKLPGPKTFYHRLGNLPVIRRRHFPEFE